MRLTIFVPFIGTILLFNDSTLSFLTLNSSFLKSIGVSSSSNGIDVFSLSTVYYIYFGLCALGIGSLIFSMLCPEEIKLNPYIMDYVNSIDLRDNTVVAK